jgi:hypothetical protein
MPHGMAESLSSMSDLQKTVFLLGEMGRSCVSDWDVVLIKIIELVYGLSKAREGLLKSVVT